MDRRQTLIGLAALSWAGGGIAEGREVPQFRVSEVRVLDDKGWADRSIIAEDLQPRFAFLLQKTVHVGVPTYSAQAPSPADQRPLRLPSFPRRNQLFPTTVEVAGHEPELAAYYRQIMELTGPEPLRREENYWLHTGLTSETAKGEVRFPYWDRLSEVEPFFAWLRTSPDGGADFFDADQGWMLRAARKGERLHLQDSVLDDGEELANLSVDRSQLLTRIDAGEAQAREVIGKLRQELGVDPWS